MLKLLNGDLLYCFEDLHLSICLYQYYLVVKHGPCEEKGQIRVDVVESEEFAHGRQTEGVVVDGEVRRQELSELNKRVLALVKKFSDKFKMGIFSFLIDDASSLLGHEKTKWNGQVVVD